jgi:tetratricopeptide (TPR) repeat protein
MESAPASGPRISVAIIVRNAAQALAATISSVRAIANEIVVLDTGSTDDTIVIALEAGAVVHRRVWSDDFAAVRNACLEKLRGDWVLWLDAGETISADAGATIRELLGSTHASARAFTLNVTVPAGQGRIGHEQVARLRLHPRRPQLRFVGRVRESLWPSLATLGIQVDALPIAIARGPSEHDPAVRTSRAQRNIRLADLMLAEQGPSAQSHNVLGEAFQSLGDYVRAAHHYRRALDLAARGSADQLEAYYGLLTCLDSVATDRNDQLSLGMLGLESFPLDAQLLVALGGYLQALDQTPLAIRAFDLAFRHGETMVAVWHLPEIREIAACCAANAMRQTGDDDAAGTLLEAAVRTLPDSSRLALQLVNLHVDHRRRDEALAAASLLSSAAERQRLSTAVRGACLAQQGNWAAAVDLLQAAMLDGCTARFCFRWLAAGWLELGRPRDAQAVLRAWESREPHEPAIAELSADAAAQLARSVRIDEAESCELPTSRSTTGRPLTTL